jgi:predicted nucleotidyltransferase
MITKIILIGTDNKPLPDAALIEQAKDLIKTTMETITKAVVYGASVQGEDVKMWVDSVEITEN